MFFSKVPPFIVLAAGIAVVISGCGRRGDLDAPSAAVAGAPQAEAAEASEAEPVADRRFILDGLID